MIHLHRRRDVGLSVGVGGVNYHEIFASVALSATIFDEYISNTWQQLQVILLPTF